MFTIPKLKKMFAGVVLAGIASLSVAQDRKEINLAIVTHGQASDTYWNVVKRGVDDAAKAMGVKVNYMAPETFDAIAMSRMIDSAVSAKVDGLVVSVPDANALGKSLRAAVAAGIPVIAIDNGEDSVEKFGLRYFVGGASQMETGVQAGKRMAATGVKKAVCINHEVGNTSLDERCAGFEKGLGSKVDVVTVTMDPTETIKRVNAYLSTHGDVTGVLTVGSTPAIAVLKGLKSAGILKKVKFATFDLSPEVLQSVKDGDMLFCIDNQQYLMGYLPVVDLTLNARYGTLPTGKILTGPGFITQNNAEQVIRLSRQGVR